MQGGSVLAGLGAPFVDNQLPSAWRITLPMNLFFAEDNMKSPFIVRRQSLPHPLAEHRWDRIYQLLLRWSSTVEQEQFVPRSHQMEVEDESSNLCPSVDATASAIPNHRATTPAVALPCQGREGADN